ncbi:MAG: hypothetical protein HY581_00785 [Nitrospirae bacterium]|nr:hypothetical protein [Nitrospirota bacterium]
MTMRLLQTVIGIGSLIGLMALAGCAGKGEVVYLDIQAAPLVAQATQDVHELNVAVVPLEDLRPQKTRLGSRTHLGGGVTHFDVLGGKPGEVVAQVIADYLKQKGWRVWVKSPGGPEPQGGADVMMRGQVQQFSANAKSRFFSTEITVKTKLTIQALNAADNSTTSMNLDGARTESVFWFEPEDVQKLLNETLKESLVKLTADTKVEKRSLRLK